MPCELDLGGGAQEIITVYRGRSRNMKELNQVSPTRKPRVGPASSNPKLHTFSASSSAASSRIFVVNDCLFVDVTTSKQCLALENVKGREKGNV